MSDTEPVIQPVEQTPLVSLSESQELTDIFARFGEDGNAVKTEVPAKVEQPPKEEKVEVTPVAKVEAQPDAKADEFPENLPNEGRSEQWKKFREAHKETLKRLDTETARAKELEGKIAGFDGNTKQLDELKQQLAEREEKIAKLSEVDSVAKLVNSPDFQEKYVKARTTATAKLTELSGYADINPEDVLSAIQKTGKARYQALDDILATASDTLKGDIVAAIKQIDSISESERAEMADVTASLSKRQQEASAAKQRAELEASQQADAAWELATKEINLPDDKKAIAREFFIKNDNLQEAAKIIAKAFKADSVMAEGAAKDKEIAGLREQLQKLTSASPGINAGSQGQPTQGASFLDSVLQGASN